MTRTWKSYWRNTRCNQLSEPFRDLAVGTSDAGAHLHEKREALGLKRRIQLRWEIEHVPLVKIDLHPGDLEAEIQTQQSISAEDRQRIFDRHERIAPAWDFGMDIDLPAEKIGLRCEELGAVIKKGGALSPDMAEDKIEPRFVN